MSFIISPQYYFQALRYTLTYSRLEENMKKKSIAKSYSSIRGPYADLSLLWILRLYNKDIANGLETISLVKTLFGDKADPENPAQFRAVIAAHLKIVENSIPTLDGMLAKNLDLLSKYFGLNKIEREIIAFRAIYRINQALAETLDHAIGVWTDQVTNEVLSTALKRPIAQIEKSLSKHGRLCGSGLLSSNIGMGSNLGVKLFVMGGIISALTRPAATIYDLLSYAITRVTAGGLTFESYPHQRHDIDLIRRHLHESSKYRAKGVNILLHGTPGVGKTELVRVLATTLRLNAFEVTQIERDEETNGIHPRLVAYNMLQKLLSKTKNGLVLFDEIEDVIPKPGWIKSDGPGKAWFNKLLEENPVPTIWVSNDVWQIDPAFMRRFDIVLEVRNPPRSVRKSILTERMSGLSVDEKWIDRKANDAAVTPAIIDRINKVIRSAKIADPEQVQHYFDRLMEEHQNALGRNSTSSYPVPNEYRLDWLNTTIDMLALSHGIARSNRGRVLLYGPPGCGKTAFAHHLAKTMDRPLLLKRASDINSKWVGGTEKNLREIFREATQDNAILLLDEADSFLQDRRGAQHSWELTQVNELLTQMENFQGVFICATNFMEHLDAAAMRRFAFKVKFDYLTTAQAETLFKETLLKLGSATPNELTWHKVRQQLMGMSKLTPGDFASITDQFDLLTKQPDAEELLAELNQASEIKDGGRKFKIGFAA